MLRHLTFAICLRHAARRIACSLAILPFAMLLAVSSAQAADPLARQVLTAICGRESPIHESSGEHQPSCRTCPAFTGFAGSHEDFVLEDIYQGHFTAPKASEALAIFGGCEPHAAGFGGHALFRREKDAWHLVFYASGFRANGCLVYARSQGTSLLVCQRSDMHAGAWEIWFSEAWLEGGELKENSLFSVNGNDGTTPHADRLSSVVSRDFRKSPDDPNLILITLEETPPPSGQTRSHIVHLQFTGDHFQLAPQDVKTVEQLDQRSSGSGH